MATIKTMSVISNRASAIGNCLTSPILKYVYLALTLELGLLALVRCGASILQSKHTNCDVAMKVWLCVYTVLALMHILAAACVMVVRLTPQQEQKSVATFETVLAEVPDEGTEDEEGGLTYALLGDERLPEEEEKDEFDWEGGERMTTYIVIVIVWCMWQLVGLYELLLYSMDDGCNSTMIDTLKFGCSYMLVTASGMLITICVVSN